MVICIQRGEFCKRLTQLRMSKGVSARDMSLSIWQSPNYIVDIEGGKNYPSMEAFFYICDFWGSHRKSFLFGIQKSKQSNRAYGNRAVSAQ